MRLISLLAFSFAFSAWSDRMWNFAIALYLIKLTPGSLQLAAIYGLVSTCISILLSPIIGDWVDNTGRLKVVRWSLLIQNTLVILSAVFVMLLLYDVTENKILIVLMQIGVIIFGALANLVGQGEKIAITKDWIVVLCSGDKALLAQVNACFRRIDLTVAILAPVLIGFLMSLVTTYASVILICVWNVASFFAEYFLLYKVYHNYAPLSEKKFREENSNILDESKIKLQKRSKNILTRFKSVINGWAIYKNQNVMLAGISLAFLYLTALGFNAITSGFAYDQGLKEMYVSICFGLGSLFGIFGTIIYPLLRSKLGLVKTGIVGFLLQISTLMLCVASIWLPGSNNVLNPLDIPETINSSSLSQANTTQTPNTTPSNSHKDLTSIIVFMTGVILSRSGLWMIDLTVTQLQQENVDETERGNVGGVQNALNSTFDLTHFVITIFLPDPKQFCFLILISVSSVTLGMIVYVAFSCTFKDGMLQGGQTKKTFASGEYEAL